MSGDYGTLCINKYDLEIITDTKKKKRQSRLGTYIGELAWLNTDWEGSNMGISTLELDSIRHRRETQDSGARREEMTGIVVRVEANEVAVKDTEQDLATDGKDSVDFG